MDSICCFRPNILANTSSLFDFYRLNSPTYLRFGFPATPLRRTTVFSFEIHAKKKKKSTIIEPTPSKVEELLGEEEDEEEEEQVTLDDFKDELLMDDEDDDEDDDLFLEEDFDEGEDEFYAGDGGGGGGIKLAGTWWDKKALALAEAVCDTFNGDLGIYAFKTLPNSTIQVRIERLTNKSGSPNMEDIEAYSTTYRARLADAELTKSIPDNISLEVSSPGVERVVRIPQDLDRYKDRPMYVKYANEVTETDGEGIFRLVSFDVEAESCIWGIADIRVNREKAGKGRPLSKKQREWRLETSFQSLRLVRLHSEC